MRLVLAVTAMTLVLPACAFGQDKPPADRPVIGFAGGNGEGFRNPAPVWREVPRPGEGFFDLEADPPPPASAVRSTTPAPRNGSSGADSGVALFVLLAVAGAIGLVVYRARLSLAKARAPKALVVHNEHKHLTLQQEEYHRHG